MGISHPGTEYRRIHCNKKEKRCKITRCGRTRARGAGRSPHGRWGGCGRVGRARGNGGAEGTSRRVRGPAAHRAADRAAACKTLSVCYLPSRARMRGGNRRARRAEAWARGAGRMEWWCEYCGCNGGRARCPHRAARVLRGGNGGAMGGGAGSQAAHRAGGAAARWGHRALPPSRASYARG